MTTSALETTTPLTVGPGSGQGAELPYVATLHSDQSRRSMANALMVVADIVSASTTRDPDEIPWHRLRNPHVQAIATALVERFAPSTENQRLCALRGVLKAAWRAGLMDSDTYARAIDVKPVRGHREPSGRALETGELAALFASCAEDTTPAGARDAAALALLVGAGLRRTEAAPLDLADRDLEDDELRVIGKGNRERIVPLQNGTLDALSDWVAVRGTEPGALLLAVTGGRVLTTDRLTGDALLRICLRRGKKAQVKAFSPHDLRRTFASSLLDARADISSVQGLLGHASVVTTQRYDRRGERAKRKAAGMLHIPYTSRAVD
ncbi:MAG: tyrosine-type recombinase/integrase [Deltaproteobacteria bacterium]|nr:tyrosine-type recombinase/integrase [Deltaproteobacteria bacterium]MBW2724960.1 tyrosine-type recombinase/integrase [Deltaproteobacteria bacterium]